MINFENLSELAIELRRLQYGERPVTSTESKRRVQEFLSTIVSSNEPSTSAQQARESFRSSSVLNELSELGTQRRVSSVLNTNRANLERSLQRLLAGQRPATSTTTASTNITANPGTQMNPLPEINPPSRLSYSENRNPINSIEQVTREQIISEISELVHTQLVTNRLQNAEFRSRLERRVLDSLRRSGTDGNQTREYLRQVALNATNRIERNDFSHLGIYNPTQLEDNSDSASSIVARPTTRIIHNSREIKELKSEINELKNLLKLSFELQLDAQRAFRQEISALVSGTFANSASASLINTTQPADEGNCIICTDNRIDSVLIQCGHMVCCFKCSNDLKQKGYNCPVCRAPIREAIRTYKCSLLE